MVLARFSDSEAIVQLWNRYYTAVYIAARTAGAESSRLTHLVASGFRRRLAQAEKQHIRISTFLAGWFHDAGARDLPQPMHKAVSWAFYSMNELNRSIVWHQYVDGWTPDQLVNDLTIDPDSAAGTIDQAYLQFSEYLTRSAELLDVTTVPDVSGPAQVKATLIAGLLHSSPEIVAEQGSPLPSAVVITPPLPSSRLKTAAMNSRTATLAEKSRARVSLPVKIITTGFVAAILAVGGIFASAAWNGNQADSSANMMPTTPTPTPSFTPTPTPTPTPEDTETPDSDTPSPDAETTPAAPPPYVPRTTPPAVVQPQPPVPPPATEPVYVPPYTPVQPPAPTYQPPVVLPTTQAPLPTPPQPTTPVIPPTTPATTAPPATTEPASPTTQSINPLSGLKTAPDPAQPSTVFFF